MLLPALEADLVLDGCGRHWGGAMIARHYNPANTSRARRRDDRIGWATSAFGTFETCRLSPIMSADWGRPEVTDVPSGDRFRHAGAARYASGFRCGSYFESTSLR